MLKEIQQFSILINKFHEPLLDKEIKSNFTNDLKVVDKKQHETLEGIFEYTFEGTPQDLWLLAMEFGMELSKIKK